MTVKIIVEKKMIVEVVMMISGGNSVPSTTINLINVDVSLGFTTLYPILL